METLCMKVDGAWTVLPYGQPVTNGDGIQASYETVGLWSDEERAAFGLFRPDLAPAPPPGKVEASRVLVDKKGRPAWKVMYADAPPPAPAPVPDAVTNYQARSALISAGLFDTADKAVRGSGDLRSIQAWDYANQFFRTSPIITSLSAGLKLTDAQVDDLFRAAAAVT